MKRSLWFQNTRSLRNRDKASRVATRPKQNRRVRIGFDPLETRELLTGSWSSLTDIGGNPVPFFQHEILLSDGSVLAQTGRDQATNTWIRLNISGNVARITSVPNSSVDRLFYTSDVLTDGRVLVLGGEYSDPNTDQNDTNTGEIYDPVANTWTSIANFPESKLGDAPSEVLDNGTVLVGSPFDSNTYIYNPSNNTWTQGPSLLNGDTSSEEGWVKLPDGSILSYTIGGNDPQTAERYVPSLNQWVFAGNVPVSLATNAGNADFAPELGPSILLPNGQVFWVGATDHTAIYTPPTTLTGTGSWTAGPDIPGGLGGFDSPIAEEPNGTILFSAQTLDGTFNQPPVYFEYNPSTDAISNNAGPFPGLDRTPSFLNKLLVLPDGRILECSGLSPAIYSEDPATVPQPAWAPMISSVTSNLVGTFTVTGTQLNGVSEGSTYGDDAENATNFPLVRFTADGFGIYGRTFNWTSTGVATGSTPVSTDFTLPSSLQSDLVYQMQVVANGIASKPDLFLEAGQSDYNITLQTDPTNGDYEFLANGASIGEFAPGTFNGVVLSLQAATSSVSIKETLAGAPVSVIGNPFYTDTINIGDSGGVQNILGNVLLENPGAFNQINVSDAGDKTARYVTLSTTTDSSGNNFGVLSGLAPGTISYKWADTASPISITGGSGGNTFNLNGGVEAQTINLNSGAGNDTVNVNLNEAQLNIDGGGGHDQINIGNGNTVLIAAPVNVKDTRGSASVLVNDYLDSASHTATLNDGQITGLSPGQISWTPSATGTGGVTSLHVLGGTGSDVWNVVNTSNFGPIIGGGTTWIQTGIGVSSFPIVHVLGTTGGLDVDGGSSDQSVTLGNNGSVQGLNGFVYVYNEISSGSSGLVIDDSSDTTSRTASMTDGYITGLAPAPLYWIDNTAGTYTGGVAGLILYGGSGGNTWNIANVSPLDFGTTVHTGSGNAKADVVNLKATLGGLTIDGGNDSVKVTIGSLAPSLGGTLANIVGGVIIGNILGSGTTSLILDDSGDSQTRTATLGEGSLSGIAPGAIQWFDYHNGGASSGGVNSLQVLGGSGTNTYFVAEAGAANVVSTLNTGKGNDNVDVLSVSDSLNIVNPGGKDNVNIGSAAPNLNGVLTAVNGVIDVNGAGATTLTIDDSGDTVPKTSTLNDDGHGNGSLSGLSPLPIDWLDASGSAGGVTHLLIYGGQGGNTFNIPNTGSASVSTILHPGTGNNTVIVTGQTGPFSIVNNGGPSSQFDFIVDSSADGTTLPAGKLSLRQAITLANGAAPAAPANITFDPTAFASAQTITLSSGELLLQANASINGPTSPSGTPLVTISGNNTSRVFDVQGGASGVDVAFQNLTITNGLAGPSAAKTLGAGGGVLVNDAGGSVSLQTVTLSRNEAQFISGSTIAEGGGLFIVGGTVRINDSTLSNNIASGPNAAGGAIFLKGGSLQLDDDTIASNSAIAASGKGQGGGIYALGGTLAVSYSTIAGNSASGTTAQGGGLFTQSKLSIQIVDSIIASNSAAAGPDVFGPVTLSDHNLLGNTSGNSGFSTANGDLLNVNPNLSPLGNYGGPTQTMPLQPGSPAINAGDGFGTAPATLPGLVDDWRGDGNTQDAAGNNPLSAIGGVGYAPGVFGRAFQLDGASGTLVAANTSALQSATFTISGWFNLTQAPAAGSEYILASKYDGNYHGWILRIDSSLRPTLSVLGSPNSNYNATSSAAVAINTWHFIAASFDGSTLDIYVDGVLTGSVTGSGGYVPSSTGLYIGSASWFPAGYTDGLIDEVQVYNTALASSQIKALYANAAQAGAPLLDSWNGNGNALDNGGTSNGTTVGNVSYAAGIFGDAFTFGAGGGYVDLGTGADVTGSGAFAVGAWIKTSSDGVIINQRDANNIDGEFILAVSGGKITWWTQSLGVYGFDFTSNRSVADGQWHYVLAQRLANGTGEIFIDGVLDSTESQAPTPLGSGFHIYIGEDVRDATYGYSPDNFVGQIERVGIFDGALTPAQVQLLSNVPSGVTLDQQGGARPVDGAVDIGSVEYQHGTPSGVDIEVQPTNTVVGRAISPIVVWVVDANGRAVTDSNQLVTLAIYSGPKGAKLEGTTTLKAVNGVAVFNNLTLNLAGDYTLTAIGGTLDPDFSNVFTVAPADVTQELRIKRGTPTIIGSKGEILVKQTLTITNTTDHSLTGPLALELKKLPEYLALVGQTGAYEGNPYVDVLGADRSLAPHSSVSITLTFVITGKLSRFGLDLDYRTDLLQGI